MKRSFQNQIIDSDSCVPAKHQKLTPEQQNDVLKKKFSILYHKIVFKKTQEFNEFVLVLYIFEEEKPNDVHILKLSAKDKSDPSTEDTYLVDLYRNIISGLYTKDPELNKFNRVFKEMKRYDGLIDDLKGLNSSKPFEEIYLHDFFKVLVFQNGSSIIISIPNKIKKFMLSYA